MIESYTIDDLKNQKRLILTEPLNNIQFNLLNNLKENRNIKEIEFCYNDYNNINSVINYVNGINDKITFKKWIKDFDEQNIKELYLIDKPNLVRIYLGLPNTKIITLDKLLYLEKLLDLFVKDIKESNLSIYEKYLCIYRILTKFKEYKEEPHGTNINLSRNLYDILENEYIVCVGYAVLLKTLANRIGINMIACSVFINEDEVYYGHKRNLFYLEDKKYSIKGIYISDTCWDSDYNKDLLIHSSLTEEEIELEDVVLERNWCEILNLNNEKEFLKKIQEKNVIENLIYAIKNLLKSDYDKIYNKYLYNIYERDYKKLIDNTYFINELYNIIKNVNKNKISEQIKTQASREVDKFIYKDISKKSLNEIESIRKKDNEIAYKKYFKKN